MQTFLPIQAEHPYECYILSARVLDPDRLGNQAYRECLTLARGGWANHPAAKIWAEHRRHLCLYALACLLELHRRGRYYPKWIDYFIGQARHEPDTGPPPIIGYAPYHAGHRAALLAKNPVWYRRFGWTEKPELDTKRAYIWRLPDE